MTLFHISDITENDDLTKTPKLYRAFSHLSAHCFGLTEHNFTVVVQSQRSCKLFPDTVGSCFQCKSSDKPIACYLKYVAPNDTQKTFIHLFYVHFQRVFPNKIKLSLNNIKTNCDKVQWRQKKIITYMKYLLH